MRRRWRLWLCVTLLVAAAVWVGLSPKVYWPVNGWVKGEAFYDGMPTSWWVREAHSVKNFGPGRSIRLPPAPKFWVRYPKRRLTFLEHIPFLRDYAYIVGGFSFFPRVTNDPLALPVLLEMLRSDDAVAREVACGSLAYLGKYLTIEDQANVLDALELLAANDSSKVVRTEAELAATWFKEPPPDP